MIIFNGTGLETVAPVKIEDILVSPVELSVTARDRPVSAGADFVRIKSGTRTVTISFGLPTQNRELRAAQLQAIATWAYSQQEGELSIPDRPGVVLRCICTALPEPSARQWWEDKLKLVFTAFDDPYWISAEEKSAACGTAFFALGSAPPAMRITRTLSAVASNQAYSDGTDTMTFSTIPAGDLEIDLDRQTAAVTANNTTASIMQYYTFGSRFPIPRTGAQTITGTGTVKWRERWI